MNNNSFLENTTDINTKVTIEFLPNLVAMMTICYSTCIWIVGVHGSLLICFWINRKKLWVSKSKGILSLIVTDFLSGWSFFLLIVVQTVDNVGRYACILPLGTYLATQLMTSLQILRICIVRLLVVFKKIQWETESAKSVVLHFAIIMLTSTALCCVSLIWVKWKEAYSPCVLKELFEEDLTSVCILMLIIIASPSLLTSIIYFYVLHLLKRQVSVIQPSKSPSADISKVPENGNVFSIQDGDDPKIKNSCANLAYRKYFKKALATIGLTLLLNNIAMLPYVILLACQASMGSQNTLPAYMWFGAGLFLQTNSALSPFVYIFRVKYIRVAFQKMICCCSSVLDTSLQ